MQEYTVDGSWYFEFSQEMKISSHISPLHVKFLVEATNGLRFQ